MGGDGLRIAQVGIMGLTTVKVFEGLSMWIIMKGKDTCNSRCPFPLIDDASNGFL